MTSYAPLEQLLQQNRLDSDVCATTALGDSLSWKSWLDRYHLWRKTIASRPEQRWALYEENCFEFSAILFAIWSLNKPVYLPGNCQPGYIDTLTRFVDGFAGDFGDLANALTIPNNSAEAILTNSDCSTRPQLNTKDNLLYVFTSGSTGEPQVVAKNIRQLSSELDSLHQQWGRNINNAHIVSSVSHQHIYGLLFRCLWPLLEGWSFDSHARQYTEAFLSPADKSGVLISSPTHLSRLSSSTEERVFSKVFSSGAPLDYNSSQYAKDNFQCAVTEVLGSTETGGIAWREQESKGLNPWSTFHCVEFCLSKDSHRLNIRSPYLAEPKHWLETNDCATQISDKKFLLQGRIDRILKIEGKRLCLDDMEEKLKRHPLVSDAHILPIPKNNRLGAIICLADIPQTHTDIDRRKLNDQFKEHLLNYFERATLPKKWRYIEHLPRNTQGKLNLQEITKLFTAIDARPTTAEVLATEETEEGYTLTLKVPENLLFFDGHFDQSPILPGVVQLQWAENYARELYSLSAHFKRLEALKFQKIATPGITLNLQLKYNADNQKITFVYTSPAGQHASGRIVLEA